MTQINLQATCTAPNGICPYRILYNESPCLDPEIDICPKLKLTRKSTNYLNENFTQERSEAYP